MFTSPPFALFCLVDVAVETVNRVLDANATNVGGIWYLWVASDNTAAPEKNEHIASEGTKAPISSVPSNFIGKSLDNVIEWMRAKPENIDLDAHHFVIIDKGAENDGTVVLGRIGGPKLEGDQVYIGRLDEKDAALHLAGLEYGTWEDLFGKEQESTKIQY